MPLENFAQPEVAVAAAAAAVAASPSLRHVVRRSLVYGVAGALIAFDRTAAAARGLTRGVQEGVASLSPDKDVPPPPNPQAAPTAPPPAQSPIT